MGCIDYNLLQPGEEHNDQRHKQLIGYRQKELTDLEKSLKTQANRVMCYLTDGSERPFVSEELMLIPEDTELPLDYVQKW